MIGLFLAAAVSLPPADYTYGPLPYGAGPRTAGCYGDCIHDDAPAINAALKNLPVHRYFRISDVTIVVGSSITTHHGFVEFEHNNIKWLATCTKFTCMIGGDGVDDKDVSFWMYNMFNMKDVKR